MMAALARYANLQVLSANHNNFTGGVPGALKTSLSAPRPNGCPLAYHCAV